MRVFAVAVLTGEFLIFTVLALCRFRAAMGVIAVIRFFSCALAAAALHPVLRFVVLCNGVAVYVPMPVPSQVASFVTA